MKKLSENKVLVAVIVFGIIIVVILLAMLHQQKQNSPEGQEASYSKRIEESRDAESKQDADNEKLYAKKAAKMKGRVLEIGGSEYYTKWTKQDFVDWANNYLAMSERDRHQKGVSESFGTSETVENDSMTCPLDEWAKQIKEKGVPSGYYETVKEFNKAYPAVNPDDIR